MFVICTDYGVDSPYVGELELVLRTGAPLNPVVRLVNDLPRQDIRAAAYLVAAYAHRLPLGSISLCIVDPGVGTDERAPVVVQSQGRSFIGPDNGLFDILARRFVDTSVQRIGWRPDALSPSFWGRDLYAPAAVRLAHGEELDLSVSGLSGFGSDWPDEASQVIYCDHFGNAMLGLRAAGLSTATRLQVGGTIAEFGNTFNAVTPGVPFWYRNSIDLVEVAVNRGSARDDFAMTVGTAVKLHA